MAKLKFRGASITHFDVRHKGEAGMFARIHCRADLADATREHFGWSDLPDGLSEAKLIGGLTGCKTLQMMPTGERSYVLEIPVESLDDFRAYRVESEGGAASTEIRFHAVSRGECAGHLEAYLGTFGTAEGVMQLSYWEQGNLPLEQEEERQDEEQALPHIHETSKGRKRKPTTAEASVQ